VVAGKLGTNTVFIDEINDTTNKTQTDPFFRRETIIDQYDGILVKEVRK